MASDLSLLFTLRAKNEASNEIKALETSISVLKARIRELKTESSSPFKTQQLGILNDLLKQTTQRHRELTKETKETAKALQQDLGGALQVVAPRLAALAGSAGPIALAAAGLIATGVAAVALGQHLFELSKQTADFQGKLFDLSQQTGVSVETLSALEVIAVQTGGSIDSVVASLGIFQKNMEESNDANSKAAKRFKELNVEVTDTEATLRATLLALSKMPESAKQTATALDLFGRGGKQLLAVLKETNGDLDATIRKLDEMGVLISSETAKAADEFNDQLALLQFQLRGLGAETIPTVLTALQSLSEFLKENRDAFDALGLAIKGVALVFVEPLKGAIILLNHELQTHRREVLLLKTAYESLRDAISGVSTTGTAVSGGVNLQGRSGLALLQEAARAGTPIGPGKPSDDLLRQAGLLNATGGRGSASDDEAAFQRKVNEKINAFTAATVRAMAENEAEMVRGIEAAKKRLGEFQLSQTEAIRQGFFGDKSELDKANEFVRFLEQAGLKLKDIEIAELRFDAVLIQSLEHAKELASALGEIIELTPGPSGEPGSTALPNIAGILGEDAPEALRSWKDALIDVQDQMVSFADFANGSLNGAIVGLADSLAQGVVAWALYGQSFGKAMRQALASLAAKIAAEAAFQAALHGAYAIASLAFGDFAGAAQHAIAAAKFAGVAALAGLGAKAIAGNTFTSAGAGGGSSTQSRTTATAPSGPNPVNIDRNRLDIHFHVTRDEGSMVRAWVQDWRNNGQTRQVAQEDH